MINMDKLLKNSGCSRKTVLLLLLIFVIVLVTGIMSKVGNTNTRKELEQYCIDMQLEINDLRDQVQSLSKEVEILKNSVSVKE